MPEADIQTLKDVTITEQDGIVRVLRTEDDGIRELVTLDFTDPDRAGVMTDVGAALALVWKSLLTDAEKSFVGYRLGYLWAKRHFMIGGHDAGE
jgi:hypothetical protein